MVGEEGRDGWYTRMKSLPYNTIVREGEERRDHKPFNMEALTSGVQLLALAAHQLFAASPLSSLSVVASLIANMRSSLLRREKGVVTL